MRSYMKKRKYATSKTLATNLFCIMCGLSSSLTVKTPVWLHYDSIHSKITKIEMETQRNTRTRLRNILVTCAS